MPVKHRRMRHRRKSVPIPKPSKKTVRRCVALLLAAGLLWSLVRVVVYVRDLSSAMAMSDAEDIVVGTINEAVIDILRSGDYGYDYFVTQDKDQAGNIVSLDTNMSRVNAFSSQLLYEVAKLDREAIPIHIPMGNLAGSSLLLSKGPNLEIEMIMLTSAHIEFQSQMQAAGINQTEHRLVLRVVVDIDVLVPWGRISSQVVREVIIAETVIVGNVPNMYVNTTENDLYGLQTGDRRTSAGD